MKTRYEIRNKRYEKRGGFTLIEMIIAVGLFSLIASMALGAVITIFDANNRSESSKTVVDNLNLSLENMVRTVRFGSNYHCIDGDSGGTFDLDEANDCSNPEDAIAVSFRGNVIVYALCNGEIRRSETPSGEDDCDDNDMQPITSPDTVIEELKFFVFGGNEFGNDRQPYVVASISGYVGTQPTEQSKFNIQTVMSQRQIDL